MACYINIEDRYRGAAIRERQMQHVWAATAAAVISVGATAAGTAISMNASQRAAAQQAAAGKKLTKAQQEALRGLESSLQNIQAPQWNLGADIADAERITGYNAAQLEKLYPGATSQREMASRAISDYMRGIIPQDVQQETMRNVAELAGAGFRPQAGPQAPGGFQAPQALLSRNLGLTSLNLQQAGMGLSMDWQKLAGAFIESPLQVGQARLGFEKARADIEMQKAAALYGGQTEVAQGAYGTSMNTIGANLASRQAMAQGIQSMGSAASGLISGVKAAFQLNDIAKMAGTKTWQGQEFESVKGFEGQTYRPQVTSSGALYYTPQQKTSASAQRALTGAYG